MELYKQFYSKQSTEVLLKRLLSHRLTGLDAEEWYKPLIDFLKSRELNESETQLMDFILSSDCVKLKDFDITEEHKADIQREYKYQDSLKQTAVDGLPICKTNDSLIPKTVNDLGLTVKAFFKSIRNQFSNAGLTMILYCFMASIISACTVGAISERDVERMNGLIVYQGAPCNKEVYGNYPNGKMKYRARFKNGLKDGEARQYYEDGALYQWFNYQEGYRDGEQKTFFQNGQLNVISNYINGQLHGLMVIYGKNGKVESKENYEFGIPHGVCEYFDSMGKLEKVQVYKAGKAIREEYFKYYTSGLQYEMKLVNHALRTDTTIRYNDQGLLVKKIISSDSRKVEELYSDGELITTMIFSNGKKLGCIGKFCN